MNETETRNETMLERNHVERDRREGTRPDDRKSPERLEQEADQARARLEKTVSALSNRLSPGELLDQGLRMIRDNGGEIGRNLGNQVKQNPMPLLLTGVGLAWLMFGSGSRTDGFERPRGRADRQGQDASSVYRDASSVVPTKTRPDDSTGLIDRVTGMAIEAKDKVTGTIDSTKARVHDMTDAVKDTTQSARARVQETALHTRETVADLLDEQPLLIGGLGIVVGAALGAMLPSTETENRLFGEASSRLTSKAKKVATEQYGRVKDTLQDAADQVTAG
jgi:hypothetical protein